MVLIVLIGLLPLFVLARATPIAIEPVFLAVVVKISTGVCAVVVAHERPLQANSSLALPLLQRGLGSPLHPGEIPNGFAIDKNILDHAGAVADSHQRVARRIGLAAMSIATVASILNMKFRQFESVRLSDR